MIEIAIILLLALSAYLAVDRLRGHRRSDELWMSEVERVRNEAAAAERRMHALTREAFVAMAEEAERKRYGGQ